MAVACSTSVGCDSTLDEALARIASIGIPQIDLLAIDGWVHVHTRDLASRFEETAGGVDALLAKYHLTPIALNTGVGPQLHDRSAEANARRLNETQALIQLMKRYGISIAAIQPRNQDSARPYADVLRDCVATLREQMEMGTAAGVTFALELHVNSPFETMEQARMLLDAMPDIALVYDPTHFVMQGIDLKETLWLLPNARHAHLRDADRGRIQAPFGTGAIDFDWLLGALRDSGYRGNFSIEYLQTGEFDVLASARQLYDRLVAYETS